MFPHSKNTDREVTLNPLPNNCMLSALYYDYEFNEFHFFLFFFFFLLFLQNVVLSITTMLLTLMGEKKPSNLIGNFLSLKTHIQICITYKTVWSTSLRDLLSELSLMLNFLNLS